MQKSLFLILATALLFYACGNDLKDVKMVNANTKTPDESMKGVTMTYTDSGLQRAILKTPLIYKYGNLDTKTEFPNGLVVYFYDKKGKKESYLEAGYGILNEKSKILVLEKKVFMIHYRKNDTLNTNYLVWKQDSAIITTPDTVHIWGQSGRFTGNHFRAKENFTGYTCKRIKADYLYYDNTDTL